MAFLLILAMLALSALAVYLAASIGYPETPAQRRKRYRKHDARRAAERAARRNRMAR